MKPSPAATLTPLFCVLVAITLLSVHIFFPNSPSPSSPSSSSSFSSSKSVFHGEGRKLGSRTASNSFSSLAPISGINVFGLLSHSFGLGRAARNVVKCLLAANESITAVDMTADLLRKKGDVIEDYGSTPNYPAHSHSFDLFALNMDLNKLVLKKVHQLDRNKRVKRAYSKHYRIALWHWETSSLPLPFGFHAENYNEIWTPTQYIADAIRNTPTFVHTAKVVVLPYGVAGELPLAAGSLKTESRARLYNYTTKITQFWPLNGEDTVVKKWSSSASKTTLFLVIFDFQSDYLRKNVLGSIAAFEEAFPIGSKEDVGLVIKTTGFKVIKDDAALVMAHIAKLNDSRIYCLGGVSSDEDLFDLKRGVDCYVSLHRSEGLGLNLLEAIFSGVPTISTAYSGSEDFMNLLYGKLAAYFRIAQSF